MHAVLIAGVIAKYFNCYMFSKDLYAIFMLWFVLHSADKTLTYT